MSGVMIPIPDPHSWRAEILPHMGCAKWGILTEGLKRVPDFWDIMLPLFRVVHYFRNIMKMEVECSSEILEIIYVLHGVRSQTAGLILFKLIFK
jgi:hypothetical protein